MFIGVFYQGAFSLDCSLVSATQRRALYSTLPSCPGGRSQIVWEWHRWGSNRQQSSLIANRMAASIKLSIKLSGWNIYRHHASDMWQGLLSMPFPSTSLVWFYTDEAMPQGRLLVESLFADFTNVNRNVRIRVPAWAWAAYFKWDIGRPKSVIFSGGAQPQKKRRPDFGWLKKC